MWKIKQTAGIKFFELEADPRFSIIFTTRTGGVSEGPFRSLNFGYSVGDQKETVDQNFALLQRALSIERLVTLDQIHSNKVFYARDSMTEAGDGLFTDRPGLALAVKVADCLPIYFFNSAVPAATTPGVEAIASIAGIVHAGWRGTAKQIAAVLVREMTEKFKITGQDLLFAFGPGIGPCCYEIGPDVREIFGGRFITERNDRWYLDLKAANRALLSDMDLTEAGSLDVCTRCNPDFFYSTRRETPTGRNLALIRIKEIPKE